MKTNKTPKNSGHQKSALETVLWAGFVAGTLDALAGIVVYWLILGRMNIIQILQWIASGVFGNDAFEGGLTMALVGNIFHYGIAYFFTVLYFVVAQYWPALKKYTLVSGLLYGLIIWALMNLLILPLSNVNQGPFEPLVAAMAITWHMLLVGLPITKIINKYFSTSNKSI